MKLNPLIIVGLVVLFGLPFFPVIIVVMLVMLAMGYFSEKKK